MSRTREGLERKRQGHLREGKQAARGVHVRKQLEGRDRRVKSQKIWTISRFVRVILAQGPC